jgi:curved DNA-binding protein CbpA
LEHSATSSEIKKAYFALVREHPPERDAENFKRIRAAYEKLREPERREESDMQLLQSYPEPRGTRRPPQLDLEVHSEDIIALVYALSDLERTDWRDYYKKITL